MPLMTRFGNSTFFGGSLPYQRGQPRHGPSRVKVLRVISLVFQPSSHLIWTSEHFPSGYSKGTSPPTNRQTGAREARGGSSESARECESTHQGPSHDRSVGSSSSFVPCVSKRAGVPVWDVFPRVTPWANCLHLVFLFPPAALFDACAITRHQLFHV
ncbi:hypothetical protein EDB85DRAFT_1136092 [Lactarius pseudohatsudake]|nr:hypothetical protein EDB85DRAFT_1136092 [Lactarius pseudohatsudake]